MSALSPVLSFTLVQGSSNSQTLNDNQMTKIRPAVNLESPYYLCQAKIKIVEAIVFMISMAHVHQSA